MTRDEWVDEVMKALGDDEQKWEEFMQIALEMVRQQNEVKS